MQRSDEAGLQGWARPVRRGFSGSSEAAVLRVGHFATECAAEVMSYTVWLSRLALALSDALDLVGVDVVQHGKRVALFAVECGREPGWSEAELRTLCFAALLHDCGVSSTEVHKKLVGEFDWEELRSDHCERGRAAARRRAVPAHCRHDPQPPHPLAAPARIGRFG